MVPMCANMLRTDQKRWGLRVCRRAWLLGVSVREYRELEAGARFPSPDTYDRMCELYGVVTDVRGASNVGAEDAGLATQLAPLGPGALNDLQRVLEGTS